MIVYKNNQLSFITEPEIIVTPKVMRDIQISGFNIKSKYIYTTDLLGFTPESLLHLSLTLNNRPLKISTMRKVKSLREQVDNKSKEIVLKNFPFITDSGGNKMFDWFDYQIDAIGFMLPRRNYVLSLQQGMGKTVCSLVNAKLKGYRKILIIGPDVSKSMWMEAIVKHGFGESSSIFHANNKLTAPPMNIKYVVANYNLLSSNNVFSLLKYFVPDHIIFDEGHFIKNSTSSRHKSGTEFIFKLENVDIGILTGTPYSISIEDYYGYFRYMGVVTSVYEFRKKFMDEFKTHDNITDSLLFNSIISRYFFRRTKDDSNMNLPEKNRIILDADIAYDKETIDAYSEIDFDASPVKRQSAIRRAQKLSSLQKVPFVIKKAESMIATGVPKIIIYTQFRYVINMLKQHFIDSAVIIDGRSNKAESERLFKTDENIKILIGQTQACGISINLANCSYGICVDVPFTATELEQAEDRMHRPGAKNNITIYIISANSLDKRLINKVLNRFSEASTIVDNLDKKPDDFVKEKIEESWQK